MKIIFFLFFPEFYLFSIENFKVISNLGLLKRMLHMTKHVSKAVRVDPGDRATLPVKRVTLSSGKHPLILSILFLLSQKQSS